MQLVPSSIQNKIQILFVASSFQYLSHSGLLIFLLQRPCSLSCHEQSCLSMILLILSPNLKICLLLFLAASISGSSYWIPIVDGEDLTVSPHPHPHSAMSWSWLAATSKNPLWISFQIWVQWHYVDSLKLTMVGIIHYGNQQTLNHHPRAALPAHRCTHLLSPSIGL